MAKLTRRAFMISGGLAGGGLLLGYAFTPNRLALRAPATAERVWLTSWVSVNADNSSTILVPQAEMGQGIFTALPMMLAEEMEADWDLVEVKPAPAEGMYVTDDIAQGFTVGEVQAPKSLQRFLDYAFYKAANMKNLQLTGGSSSVRFHWPVGDARRRRRRQRDAGPGGGNALGSGAGGNAAPGAARSCTMPAGDKPASPSWRQWRPGSSLPSRRP